MSITEADHAEVHNKLSDISGLTRHTQCHVMWCLAMKRQTSMQSVNSQGEGAADTARSVSIHKTSEDEESLNEGTRVPGAADEYHEVRLSHVSC